MCKDPPVVTVMLSPYDARSQSTYNNSPGTHAYLLSRLSSSS